MTALEATGERVAVRTVREADLRPYARAVEASAERLQARWNPVDPGDLARHLERQSEAHRTFVVHALDRAGSHGIVGKVNVSNLVRGRFCSAGLGYDAYDPYAGRGLFREGLGLVVGLALAPVAAGGMGLHRVEASVQPGNVRSAAVLRSLGFRHEGATPRMLLLPDGTGEERWRDHERYAVTAEEWPAPSYPPHAAPRRVVLVNGLPGSGKSTLAAALAAELGLPLLAKDAVKETLADHLPADVVAALGGSASALGAAAAETLWTLLGGCPAGAVVEGWWPPSVRHHAEAGLRRAGVDPSSAVEVWCDLPAAAARQRYEARAGRRHRVHGPQLGLAWWEGDGPAGASPLGLGPVLRVDTTHPLGPGTITRLALQARAAAVRRP